MVTDEVAATITSTVVEVITITEVVAVTIIKPVVVTSVSMEDLPETAITLEVDEDEANHGEVSEEVVAAVAAGIGGIKIKTNVISLRCIYPPTTT